MQRASNTKSKKRRFLQDQLPVRYQRQVSTNVCI